MTDSRDDGFTLVEVLVAFVILSGAIILSFQVFSDGLRRLAVVETRMKEVNIARAELERVSAHGTMSEGVQTGTTDGVMWKISIKNLANDPSGKSSRIIAFEVNVDVIEPAGKGKAISVINTIILSRPAVP